MIEATYQSHASYHLVIAVALTYSANGSGATSLPRLTMNRDMARMIETPNARVFATQGIEPLYDVLYPFRVRFSMG